jgi:hypothetical protein
MKLIKTILVIYDKPLRVHEFSLRKQDVFLIRSVVHRCVKVFFLGDEGRGSTALDFHGGKWKIVNLRCPARSSKSPMFPHFGAQCEEFLVRNRSPTVLAGRW